MVSECDCYLLPPDSLLQTSGVTHKITSSSSVCVPMTQTLTFFIEPTHSLLSWIPVCGYLCCYETIGYEIARQLAGTHKAPCTVLYCTCNCRCFPLNVQMRNLPNTVNIKKGINTVWFSAVSNEQRRSEGEEMCSQTNCVINSAFYVLRSNPGGRLVRSHLIFSRHCWTFMVNFLLVSLYLSTGPGLQFILPETSQSWFCFIMESL